MQCTSHKTRKQSKKGDLQVLGIYLTKVEKSMEETQVGTKYISNKLAMRRHLEQY
jgi:hypothetical protein